MLPSEKLRQQISKIYSLDIIQYAWEENLKGKLFKIELDKEIESHADTLQDIFELGFNIGHCGLTSRYIAINFPDAKVYYGIASLLIGTPDSPNGEHAWIVIDGHLIDTTLMLYIPEDKAQVLGYIPEREISYDSARILSEYDTYDIEYELLKQNQFKKMVYKKLTI